MSKQYFWGPNPATAAAAGLTPLMAAVKAGKAEMVATLLQLGANPGLGDNSGTYHQGTRLHPALMLAL